MDYAQVGVRTTKLVITNISKSAVGCRLLGWLSELGFNDRGIGLAGTVSTLAGIQRSNV